MIRYDRRMVESKKDFLDMTTPYPDEEEEDINIKPVVLFMIIVLVIIWVII